MSRPWMPLYVGDYLADTSHLSTLEHGAYMLLLMHYWRNGGLPSCDDKLARIARLTAEQWVSIKGTLEDLFYDGWKHKRVDIELAIADEKHETRVNAGKKGGERKSSNAKAKLGNAVAKPYQSQPQPHSEKKKDIRPKRVRTDYSPEFNSFWKAFPTTPNMSKLEAWKIWQDLSDEDRIAATAAVPKYAAWLRANPGIATVHACRFLSQRRFEGFNEPEPDNVVPIGFYAEFGSAELDAWDAHNRKTNGATLPRDKRGGWLVPARYPPGYEPQAATA
jgi:uncharacterized protein YdaU (DUF1376 family)